MASVFSIGMLILGNVSGAAGPVSVVNLTCEYLSNPLGIDTAQPRLSWMLESPLRGQKQTAYQVLVASSPELLAQDQGDLWDTGKVESDQSIQVAYAGKALASHQACWWKVRVWDKDGTESPWSDTARWSMGILDEAEWRAQWIGIEKEDESKMEPEARRLAARQLRKEFTIGKPVARATAYISGFGLSELYVNGAKISDHVLSPGCTEYNKRVFYVTHDVTGQIHEGANAIGVWLGNGHFWAQRTKEPTTMRTFGFPKLLLHLRIEYTDGSSDEIVSDTSWRVTTEGPIRANNEYDGEEYDARMELEGWAAPGFDDSQWDKAEEVAAPGGVISAQMIEPIRVVETIKPVAMRSPEPGVYIYDMGQNMVGWCRLTVAGPRGAQVSLRHAETINPDGTLYMANIRGAKVTDLYTLKGEGVETYEPRFVYHGFRYVEMKGFPGEPTLDALEGCVVHDDMPRAGAFTCSNKVLNDIYHNIYWGTRGNYHSMPTDCPQRDERQGWLGDRSEESRGESYLFDISALYAKWVCDMHDAQNEKGSVSDVCPAYWPLYNDNVTWPSSFIIIPNMLYQMYADTRTIESRYDGMKKWIEWMSHYIDADGIMPRDNYGDWCVPPEEQHLIHSNDPARKTPGEFLGTSYFYWDLTLMAKYAAMLGKTEDAAAFTEQAEAMKAAFNKKFFNAETAQYANGAQTTCVLPLAFGLVPEGYENKVFQRLVDKIENETKGHIGTGLIGGQWLNRVLSDHGRPDLVYTMATQTDYPSWGYMISKGATTIWELWNGDTADPAMNSHNHVMLVGDLNIWFHEYLAGIRPDQPGFKHLSMKPLPVGDLTHVQASRLTPYGTVFSEWKVDGDAFAWNFTVPENTSATVYVPARDGATVTESGKPAQEAEGVQFLRMEANAAVYEVQSGRYAFASPAFVRPGRKP